MKNIQQLIKKSNEVGRYDNVFPKTFIDAIKDRETGVSLRDILSSFNMYFLTYMGSPEDTRLQLPKSLRRMGVWITYVTWDNTVHIEWYSSDDISDETFRSSLYWKEGTNSLVGDLSISAEGNWVINGEDTDIPARGEKGITPVLRLGKNNRFQVSYNEGGSYSDITSEPIITQLRVHNNKLQKSLDLGKTWEDESDYISSYFREKDNKIQISKDKETWEDISDNIAAWFRFKTEEGQSQNNSVGKIQISRDNGATWTDLSDEFTNSLHIKGYVATVPNLPSTAVQGDIYGVGPTYDPSDTEQTNPIYQLYVKDSTGWINNGRFTSISAGVVQELGDSETAVMSQDAVSNEFASVRSDLNEIEQKQIQGGIYDVSSHNDGAVFESLSALLGSANLSTLIPTSVRHGGMSIRFIQGSTPNSDNKYVQFRYMSDDTTVATFTNTDNWAICDTGVYVENPEYIEVKTDSEGRILWAIKADGSIYYGAGIPQQVIDYINEKIAEPSLDEYEDIVAFLNDLEKDDKTLQDLLNEKVDKVEGKSLINAEYAEGVSQIENPEFAEVHTDTNDKILYGVKQNGDFYFGAGIPPQIQAELDEVAEVADNKVDKEEGKSLIDSDYASSQSAIENPEFAEVHTDTNDKILYGVKQNGDFYFGAGIPPQIQAELDEVAEVADNKVDKEEGKSLIDSDYASSQSAIDNSEYLQVTTDSEDKILEGIKASGIKEVNCPLETPSAIIGSDSNPEYKSVVTDANDRIIEGITSDNKKVIHIDTVFKGGVEGIETNMVQYNSVRDAAINNEKKLFTVGNLLYKNIVTSPSELFHKQDAYSYKYYDANGTLAQYTLVNNHKVINEEYIANKVKQEEIDFSPSDSTRTRIIVGKNDDDLFFVANVRMEYGSEEGVPSLNCLETTSDFITFTPIVKSANDQTKEAAFVQGYNNIVVKSVKQFANGDYIVAAGVNYQGWKTIFMLLSSDFSSISPITCTYLDGTTGVMADDFGNNVYDWHIDIKGSKCLATTYGNRQPETDYGRVWYTEDNGVTWKQIFQMTNHYQDGVAPEDPVVTYVHVHGVMIDDYSNRLFVIAGEGNSNLFWSDKGFDTTDNDWNVIPIIRQLPLQQQSYMQVVNGYAFENNLVFGSDNLGAGAIYRINKLNEQYSKIQVAHEFLPNKFAGTFYCGAEMFRRDLHTPLFICETHENCMLTEEENEKLNEYHKARVVATYDGVNFVEIWLDDTFGTHQTYIANEGLTTRKFSWCTRGMNFYLLKNGNAILKYSGRTHNYFGGSPMYSVQGNSKGSCKIRKFYNIEKYL